MLPLPNRPPKKGSPVPQQWIQYRLIKKKKKKSATGNGAGLDLQVVRAAKRNLPTMRVVSQEYRLLITFIITIKVYLIVNDRLLSGKG